MSKKFRVGQRVNLGGDEATGVIEGVVHTKKGTVWNVNVDGETHQVKEKDMSPVAGRSESVGTVEKAYPLPKDRTPSEEAADEEAAANDDGDGEGGDGGDEGED